jgi:GT2 family glycosyltransferase
MLVTPGGAGRLGAVMFLAISTASLADLGRARPLLDQLRTMQARVVVVVREAGRDGVDLDGDVAYVYRDRSYGLAAARNEGLAHARSSGWLDTADYVFFPDDDNVPSDDLETRVTDAFRQHPEAVGVIGVFAESVTSVDRRRFPASPLGVDRRLAESIVSSNTIYLSASAVRAIGPFDERFGLGARYGSAEDMDYALRALRVGPLVYAPDVVALHPVKAGLFDRNYPGNVAVKVKARDYLGAARLLGFGVKSVQARQLRLRQLLRGLWCGLSCLVTRPKGSWDPRTWEPAGR